MNKIKNIKILILLLFFLVIALTLGFYYVNKDLTNVVTLEINAKKNYKVIFNLDENINFVSLKSMNSDSEFLFKRLKLKDESLYTGIEKISEILNDEIAFKNKENYIFIGVKSSKNKKMAVELEKCFVENLYESIKNKQKSAIVSIIVDDESKNIDEEMLSLSVKKLYEKVKYSNFYSKKARILESNSSILMQDDKLIHFISVENAIELVFMKMGMLKEDISRLGAVFKKTDKGSVYDIEYDYNGKHYKFIVSARTGVLISLDYEKSEDTVDENLQEPNEIEIERAVVHVKSLEEVLKPFLKKEKIYYLNLKNVKFEMNQENRNLIYEIKFRYNRNEYSCTINAIDGNVLFSDKKTLVKNKVKNKKIDESLSELDDEDNNLNNDDFID